MNVSEAVTPRDERNARQVEIFWRQLSVRRLLPSDFHQLMDFRGEVLGSLEHPDIYVPEANEAEFVFGHLESRGVTFGIFLADRLVSYGMLGLPTADDVGNLGRLLGFAAAQCASVAHLAGCMTLPAFRRFGLQRHLIAMRMATAREEGRRYCIAMASLRNDASRNNLLETGMAIRWVGNIDGLRRQLLFADIVCPTRFGRRNHLVGKLDFDRQRDMTRKGWWGVAECADRLGVRLDFRRPQHDHDTSARAV